VKMAVAAAPDLLQVVQDRTAGVISDGLFHL
jgi:hypothetical protein